MGCTTSNAVEDVANSVIPSKGTEKMMKAINLHKASKKWKEYKAPIDQDLLRELGLLDDEDEEKSEEHKKDSSSGVGPKSEEEDVSGSGDLSESNSSHRKPSVS